MLRLFISAALCAVVAGCAADAAEATRTNAQGEAEIRALVEQTDAAAKRLDMKTYMLYYHPDAALVMPDGPITYGIKPGADQRPFPDPFKIEVKTEKVEASGDMGYALGTFEMTMPDPVTKVVEFSTGKWLTVFKRQANGKWGGIADTYNVETKKPVAK